MGSSSWPRIKPQPPAVRVRSLSYWTTKEVPTIVLTKAFDFTGGSDGKASACNVGDPGSTPGSGRSPGEGNGQPTPVFLPGKSIGYDWATSFSLFSCKQEKPAQNSSQWKGAGRAFFLNQRQKPLGGVAGPHKHWSQFLETCWQSRSFLYLLNAGFSPLTSLQLCSLISVSWSSSLASPWKWTSTPHPH